MNKYISYIALIGVIVLGAIVLVGNQSSEGVGGGTRFSNGLSADSTSPLAGEVRGTTFTSTGAVSFAGVVSATAEGNKIGSANSYNPIYVGAGDGCTAMLFAASSTLVSTATSTSFCN